MDERVASCFDVAHTDPTTNVLRIGQNLPYVLDFVAPAYDREPLLIPVSFKPTDIALTRSAV